MNRQDRRRVHALGLTTFLFFRKGPDGGTFFYPVDIPADQLQANVDCNPGTLRVEDLEGRIVWPACAIRDGEA